VSGINETPVAPVPTGAIQVSPDEAGLLVQQRLLALPSARIASIEEFANWLFTIITAVGTLAAAFSSTVLKSVQGAGTKCFLASIVLLGLALASAIAVRAIQPKEMNFYNLQDMLKKTGHTLYLKKIFAGGAGVCFAIALILAALCPLFSNASAAPNPPADEILGYAFGKDGMKVAGTLSTETYRSLEVRVFTKLPTGNFVLAAAQKALRDSDKHIKIEIVASVPDKVEIVKAVLTCIPNGGYRRTSEVELHLGQGPNDSGTSHSGELGCHL
jgi:hypothetical protein